MNPTIDSSRLTDNASDDQLDQAAALPETLTSDKPDHAGTPAPSTPWYLVLGAWWQAPHSS